MLSVTHKLPVNVSYSESVGLYFLSAVQFLTKYYYSASYFVEEKAKPRPTGIIIQSSFRELSYVSHNHCICNASPS